MSSENKADPSPEEWLEQENLVDKNNRLARLRWIENTYPPIDHVLFLGGVMTQFLFEESRRCFVYGQFIATIVLATAYIERTLAAIFHERGKENLAKEGLKTLTTEGLNQGLLTKDESEYIDQIREIRNPVIHFQKPEATNALEARLASLWANGDFSTFWPYDLLEKDAKRTLEIAFHFLDRVSHM